jgi:hypothetical protein
MTVTLSTMIEITDPWGKLHRAAVSWEPLPLTGLNPANDNVGETEIAFADESHCPLYWELDPSTSIARLRRRRQTFTGDYAWTIEFNRVESATELEPGSYYRAVLEPR